MTAHSIVMVQILYFNKIEKGSVKKLDNLIETNGQESMDTFIEEFSCLLKGCDYDV